MFFFEFKSISLKIDVEGITVKINKFYSNIAEKTNRQST